MKKKYKLYQVDAFTSTKFKGNPAGVISNANGLTEKEMQKIARELNNSETAFLFESDDSNYDVYTRYFTPTKEVPICGHATIASQYIRALELGYRNSIVYNKTGAGVLPVEVLGSGSNTQIAMTQGEIEFGKVLDGKLKERLLLALGIKEDDLITDTKIQIVSTGHSKVMIGINSNQTLNKLNPDMEKLKSLSSDIKCNGFYTFTLSDLEDEFLVRGRMFAPAIGINEDPVTGNANGPLGAYIVKYNLVKRGNEFFRFKALQGEAMNRPGVIEVHVKIENNEPIEVKVIGTAIIVFKSEIEV